MSFHLGCVVTWETGFERIECKWGAKSEEEIWCLSLTPGQILIPSRLRFRKSSLINGLGHSKVNRRLTSWSGHSSAASPHDWQRKLYCKLPCSSSGVPPNSRPFGFYVLGEHFVQSSENADHFRNCCLYGESINHRLGRSLLIYGADERTAVIIRVIRSKDFEKENLPMAAN
jgi:hypothetical protein